MSEHHSHGSSGSATSPEAQLHDPHAVPHDAAHFQNHAKLYLIVGGLLFLGTAITVFLSYVDFGSSHMNVTIALIVATIKASLVALIFMHLKEEKMTIYQFMLATLIFVMGMFLLCSLAINDPIHF